MTDLEDLERLLRDRLDALGPAPRAQLLRVLMLPDYDRAGRIGEFYGDLRTLEMTVLPPLSTTRRD